MATPADMPAWIGELSQGHTRDEESQTINGCRDGKSVFPRDESPDRLFNGHL